MVLVRINQAHVNKMRSFYLLILAQLLVLSQSVKLREKRGASVYPVFRGGHGAEETNFLFLYDPAPFVQYLGGSRSSSGGYSGGSGGEQESRRSFSVAPLQGFSSSTPFDTSYLSSFNLHNMMGSGMAQRRSDSGSHSSNLGYSTNFAPLQAHGISAASFANPRGMSGHYSPGNVRSIHQVVMPNLSASSLAHSASTSFNAQNNVISILNSGNPQQQSYKGFY